MREVEPTFTSNVNKSLLKIIPLFPLTLSKRNTFALLPVKARRSCNDPAVIVDEATANVFRIFRDRYQIRVRLRICNHFSANNPFHVRRSTYLKTTRFFQQLPQGYFLRCYVPLAQATARAISRRDFIPIFYTFRNCVTESTAVWQQIYIWSLIIMVVAFQPR